MTPNGDETKLRELFRDLKNDDQAGAPHFSAVVARARARLERSRRLFRAFTASAAVAMAVMLVVSMMLWNRSGEELSAPPTNDRAEAPAGPVESRPQVTSIKTVQPRKLKQASTRTRPRIRSADELGVLAAMSQWQSPTDFLLRSPGEKVLRTLPAIALPPRDIKPLPDNRIN